MFKRKAQTATEYLIILAVVIVIALIVTGVLGGIPSIGGGASEGSARAKLQVAPVGITAYSVSPAKTMLRFQNNQAKAIRIDGVTLDGETCWLIGTNAQPDATPRLDIGQSVTINCGSFTADSRFSAPVTITYTDLETNAQFTLDEDLKLVGQASSFECPDGFIPVPGGFVLADGSTVDDFCVMKYEAKAWDVSGDSEVLDGGAGIGSHWAGLNGQTDYEARSIPEGRPWVNIAQNHSSNYDAIEACRDMGPGYDLISDQQWMVMAENILNTNINDLNASQSDSQLSNGRSSMAFGDGSAAAGSDPDFSECYPEYSLDASENDNCGLRGTQGYVNTDPTYGNWDSAYNPSGDGRSDLRIHMLSNGEVIWDVAGNVLQWVSGDYSAAANNGGVEYSSSPDFTGIPWAEPSQLLSSSNGVGRIYSGYVGTVALRGGYWGNGVFAGVFYVSDIYGPSRAYIVLRVPLRFLTWRLRAGLLA